MRIMGLDFGSKTVGVAISDALLITAQGREIIRREHASKLRRTLARIEELIVENEVSEIVLGEPLNMDGSAGERVKLTLEFKEMLEIHFKIHYNCSYFRFFVNSDIWLPPKNAEGVSTAA